MLNNGTKSPAEKSNVWRLKITKYVLSNHGLMYLLKRKQNKKRKSMKIFWAKEIRSRK